MLRRERFHWSVDDLLTPERERLTVALKRVVVIDSERARMLPKLAIISIDQ